jgi:hypothetical protein
VSTDLPDLSPLLPSAARTAVRDFVLGKLKAAEVNYLADPLYNIRSFREELEKRNPDYTTWSFRMALDTFDEALEDFTRTYPKQWDNDRQRAFREIDGERKYARRV